MSFDKAMDTIKFYGSADIIILNDELYVTNDFCILGKLSDLVIEWTQEKI